MQKVKVQLRKECREFLLCVALAAAGSDKGGGCAHVHTRWSSSLSVPWADPSSKQAGGTQVGKARAVQGPEPLILKALLQVNSRARTWALSSVMSSLGHITSKIFVRNILKAGRNSSVSATARLCLRALGLTAGNVRWEGLILSSEKLQYCCWTRWSLEQHGGSKTLMQSSFFFHEVNYFIYTYMYIYKYIHIYGYKHTRRDKHSHSINSETWNKMPNASFQG